MFQSTPAEQAELLPSWQGLALPACFNPRPLSRRSYKTFHPTSTGMSSPGHGPRACGFWCSSEHLARIPFESRPIRAESVQSAAQRQKNMRRNRAFFGLRGSPGVLCTDAIRARQKARFLRRLCLRGSPGVLFSSSVRPSFSSSERLDHPCGIARSIAPLCLIDKAAVSPCEATAFHLSGIQPALSGRRCCRNGAPPATPGSAVFDLSGTEVTGVVTTSGCR